MAWIKKGAERMRNWRQITAIFVLAFGFVPGGAEGQNDETSAAVQPAFTLEFPDGGLSDLMRWTPNRIPLVSQHRGGPMPGYPENALETFANALRFGPGFLECDIRQLSDGTLILMHDRTLDRTTTGQGPVSEADYASVSALSLVDNDGMITPYRVPTLKDALDWATGRAVLNLDIKPGVDIEAVIRAVREARADEHVILISYSLEAAQRYHDLAPDLMISVGVRSMDELAAVKASGIDPARIVTWSGLQLLDRTLYDAVHEAGWRVQLGTLGFDETAIDRQIAASGDDRGYLDLFAAGVDMISTDRHVAAQSVLFTPTLVYFYRRPRPVLDGG